MISPPGGEPPLDDGWRAADASFILAIENVTGVHHISGESDPSGSDPTSQFKDTHIAFLTASGFTPAGPTVINPFAVPRVGAHGVVAGVLTLGGGLGFFSDSGEVKVEESSFDTTYSGFIVSPRFGVLLSTSPVLSFWLRGGITYASQTLRQDDGDGFTIDITTKLATLSIDPQIVLTPVPHVGITIGLALDPSVYGSQEAEFDDGFGSFSEDSDLSAFNVGLTAGLAAFF